MVTTNVEIHILPSNFNIKESMVSYLQNASISSLDEIRVNKVQNGYAVLYTDELFKRLDVASFTENLINLFRSNLPGIPIDIVIYYRFWTRETFSPECGITILQMDDYMEDYPGGNTVSYITSESVEAIYQAYDEDDGTFDFDAVEDPDGSDDDLDYTDEDEDIDIDPEVLESLAQYIDIERDNSGGKKGKGKKKLYGSSRVLNSVKHPKKDYKRHGIIVANDKSALKKDEKILREFLKDFIPGKAGWIKDYREDVLERFMRMYVVSKKTLKKLEKHHRKHKGSKGKDGKKISKESAMNFTRNILNRDSWNNPNK